MKELTREEWMKNPTPRMMWVWCDETLKRERKVIYFLERDVSFPGGALDEDGIGISVYEHCAEIAKPRRMTNKELSRWLRENTTRELKMSNYVYQDYNYRESEQDAEIGDYALIRENDGEWREPLVLEDNNNDND